jgi:tetratricopeptide (TPR) repeat protein
MRVAEDTAMNKRLDRLATCVWAPDVQTTHKEPSSYWGLFRDNFGRGVRMATEQPFRGTPGKKSGRAQHWLALSWRNGLVRRLFADEEEFNLRMSRGMLRVSFTITLAKYLGVLRGISRQTKADRLLHQAQKALSENGGPASDTRALTLAQRAAELDSQDPPKLLFLGKALVRLGHDGSDAFRAALALDPAQPEALAQILAPLVAKSDWPNALATAETAAETSPQVAELWMIAADVAQKAGRNALAIAYMQRSLCLAPSLPAAHSKAERLYQALGDQTAATHRSKTADRLSAYRATFKEIGD